MEIDEDGCALELNLELCLGMRPKGVSQSIGNGGHGKDRVPDRSQGYENGRGMSIAGGDAVDPPQSRFDCGEHSAEFCQKSCCSEVDDPLEFLQRLRRMSTKTAAASVEVLHVAGCVSPASSALPRSVSDETGRLSSAPVDEEQWKGAVYQQHGVDQQRKRELHVQKRQAERKKRKLLLLGEQKQQKLLETSKPFPSSLYTQKSEKKDYGIECQEEETSEGLLERRSSKSLSASQVDKMEEKQAILQEERAQFHDFLRAPQREQDRTMTDKEAIWGSKPKEHDEANRPAECCSDYKSSQAKEEPNKLETAQWIQKFHELRKMMSPAASSGQKKIPASAVTSDVSPGISEEHCRNAEQVHIPPKKLESSVGKKEDIRNKRLNSKDLKPLKDEISARNESQDSPVAGLHLEAAAAPFSLPTAASFIPNPLSFPMYVSNVNGVSYPVPYFLPYLAAHPYGESSFTSYQFPSLPAGGTPFQMAASQTTSSCQTPVLQPTPVRYSPVSRTKQSKSPGGSRQQENCSQGEEAAFSPKETQTPGFPSKPSQSGAISSESKGRSWLDQADSHALSGTTSGLPEEAAASGPAHSGKSSSSSGVYQSAHGETVESNASKSAGEMNDQANQGNDQETTTQTGGVGTACKQEAAHKKSPSAGAPFVSTTANGNTITGVLYTYSKGEVKICCKCHGMYMNAREFVIHAGGVDSPHPERSILVNLFPFTNQSPAMQG